MKRMDYYLIFFAGVVLGSGAMFGKLNSTECDAVSKLIPKFTVTADDAGIHIKTE